MYVLFVISVSCKTEIPDPSLSCFLSFIECSTFDFDLNGGKLWEGFTMLEFHLSYDVSKIWSQKAKVGEY